MKEKKVLTKGEEVAGSNSFLLAIVTFILGFFSLNGTPIESSPETIVDALGSGQVALVLTILATNFIKPVLKIVENGVNWKVIFKNPNFWTQITTVILAFLAVLGLVIPEETALGFLDAVIGKGLAWYEILIAVLVHFGNTLFHFFSDLKGKVEEKEVLLTEQTEMAIKNVVDKHLANN